MGTIKSVYEQMPVIRELRGLTNELLYRVRVMERVQHEQLLMQLLTLPRYADPRHLARFEQQTFSQHGEDGILTEIFRRIGSDRKTFVEIGTGNGLENNTVFWLLQGWSGLWIDGDPQEAPKVRQSFSKLIKGGKLKFVEVFVNRENIGQIVRREGFGEELDLLSLDIDQNTYWIWEGLAQLKPRVVVVEYNSTMPAHLDWKSTYGADRVWDKSMNFGASLKAFELLGTRLGYNLVGCDLSGVNAFFVRQDLCGDRFVDPFAAETFWEPPRLWMMHTAGYERSARVFESL